MFSQNLGLELSLDVSYTNTKSGVHLTWSGVHNGETSVFRKLVNEKTWTKVGVADKGINSIKDSGALDGFAYHYKLEMSTADIDTAAYNSAFGYISVDLRTDLNSNAYPF